MDIIHTQYINQCLDGLYVSIACFIIFIIAILVFRKVGLDKIMENPFRFIFVMSCPIIFMVGCAFGEYYYMAKKYPESAIYKKFGKIINLEKEEK